MKISEVISALHEWHQPFQKKDTRDTVKWGDPDQECTGIVITVCATVDVIRKAAELKANLIISHESIFYGDEFALEDFGDDLILKEKQARLDSTGIVVWRDHDHMHGSGKPWVPERLQPDYIYYGIMKELGWDEYVFGDDPLKPTWYRIPETTVEELAQLFLEKFGLTGLRYVGDPEAKVSTVYVCEHVTGQGNMMEKFQGGAKADVMIPLEINDWTLAAYVRDAAMLGHPKAILEMGHFNTEELGMKYMLQWLPEAVGSDLPIHFVPAGDHFGYILKK